ncbi:MAG: HAD-IB family phosphatase [Leptospirales bacterium]
MRCVVFSDFDGTITSQESFVRVLETFAPEASSRLIPRMYDLTLPLREGVRLLLESIESRHYPEMLDSVARTPLRPGFESFLGFLESRAIPFIIVTGGIASFVRAALGPLEKRVHAIYGADLDTGGTTLSLHSDWESGTELVSKPLVLETVRKTISVDLPVMIGDSVTDLEMALACPVAFARDRLARYLDERKKPYYDYDDFVDIQRTFQEKLLT